MFTNDSGSKGRRHPNQDGKSCGRAVNILRIALLTPLGINTGPTYAQPSPCTYVSTQFRIPAVCANYLGDVDERVVVETGIRRGEVLIHRQRAGARVRYAVELVYRPEGDADPWREEYDLLVVVRFDGTRVRFAGVTSAAMPQASVLLQEPFGSSRMSAVALLLYSFALSSGARIAVAADFEPVGEVLPQSAADVKNGVWSPDIVGKIVVLPRGLGEKWVADGLDSRHVRRFIREASEPGGGLISPEPYYPWDDVAEAALAPFIGPLQAVASTRSQGLQVDLPPLVFVRDPLPTMPFRRADGTDYGERGDGELEALKQRYAKLAVAASYQSSGCADADWLRAVLGVRGMPDDAIAADGARTVRLAGRAGREQAEVVEEQFHQVRRCFDRRRTQQTCRCLAGASRALAGALERLIPSTTPGFVSVDSLMQVAGRQEVDLEVARAREADPLKEAGRSLADVLRGIGNSLGAMRDSAVAADSMRPPPAAPGASAVHDDCYGPVTVTLIDAAGVSRCSSRLTAPPRVTGTSWQAWWRSTEVQAWVNSNAARLLADCSHVDRDSSFRLEAVRYSFSCGVVVEVDNTGAMRVIEAR